MRLSLICLVLGLSLTLFLPELPARWLLWLTVLVALSLTVAAGFRFRVFIFPAMVLLGFSYGGFHGHTLMDRLLPSDLESINLHLSAEVDELPLRREGYTSMLMRDLVIEGQSYQGRVRLSWHGAPEVKPGQRWNLTVRLKRPSGFSSPGAMDYEGWLLRQQVIATGYVRDDNPQLLGDGGWMRVDRWRWQLAQFIESHYAGDRAAIYKALLLGDKRDISPRLWDTFNQTGTTHLLVISGLHIGLMALVGWWFARLLVLLGVIPLEIRPLPKVGALIGLCFALVYAFMAGFSIPAQRALVMLVVALGGILLDLKIKSSTLLLLALTVVVLLDPLAFISNGFWYSFIAVSALLYVFSGAQSTHRVCERFVRPQVTVFVVLAPLLALNLQPVSALSPLVNLVSIPLVGLLVVPLLFAGVALSVVLTSLGLLVMDFAGVILDVWVSALQWSEGLTIDLPPLAVPNGLALILAMVGVVLLLTHSGLGFRWLALACFLPWLVPANDPLSEGMAEVTVFDVGQGQAALVCTRNHCLVYDTGDRFSERFTAAGAVVIPYLRHHPAASSPDMIVISHNDRDHRGGLDTLLDVFPFSQVYVSEADDYPLPVYLCHDQKEWFWDGVRFRFLSTGSRMSSRNDRSCVLQIQAGKHAVLLTGDISARAEQRLVRRYGDELVSQVLVVAHHGSAGSSGNAFLSQVKPTYASISAGYRNRFGHPSPRVRERLGLVEAEILETPLTGTQVFQLGGESLPPPYCHRLQKAGYWSRKPLS
ncbi:MAG: DNA internalization-related competence protein ComEC/Rec2 [Oceanospirillales bacterium LUC14_002_19_P2]|nr:MAG: DNA internalization-related competence protein ComEC/Rec2 [Oceanospirillales bacterium LUC14_002_19_P2]